MTNGRLSQTSGHESKERAVDCDIEGATEFDETGDYVVGSHA